VNNAAAFHERRGDDALAGLRSRLCGQFRGVFVATQAAPKHSEDPRDIIEWLVAGGARAVARMAPLLGNQKGPSRCSRKGWCVSSERAHRFNNVQRGPSNRSDPAPASGPAGQKAAVPADRVGHCSRVRGWSAFVAGPELVLHQRCQPDGRTAASTPAARQRSRHVGSTTTPN